MDNPEREMLVVIIPPNLNEEAEKLATEKIIWEKCVEEYVKRDIKLHKIVIKCTH
jgi:hypothetical protein